MESLRKALQDALERFKDGLLSWIRTGRLKNGCITMAAMGDYIQHRLTSRYIIILSNLIMIYDDLYIINLCIYLCTVTIACNVLVEQIRIDLDRRKAERSSAVLALNSSSSQR